LSRRFSTPSIFLSSRLKPDGAGAVVACFLPEREEPFLDLEDDVLLDELAMGLT
jgi:hypothetical protein